MYTGMKQIENRKFFVWRWSSICLALLLFLCLVLPVFATETTDASKLSSQLESAPDSEKTIVVGYPILEGVSEIDFDGRYRGYDYEYLQDIAGYSGWEYKFVVDTWDNCMKAVQNGTIDVMGFVSKGTEEPEALTYSRVPAGIAMVTIVANEKNKKIEYMNLKSMAGYKIGVLQGSRREKILDDFCAKKNITLEKKYFNTEAKLLRALEAGTIDLALSSNFENGGKTKLIADVKAEPFYFAVGQKGAENEKIIEALDNAMNEILLMQPEYHKNLEDGYIYGESKKKLDFTKEELEFIKHSEPIKIAYDTNYAPISYYNEKTKEADGAMVRLFNKIEQLTGLEFEFVKTDSYSEALDLAKNGNVDLINNVIRDYAWAETYNLKLTPQYVTFPTDYVSNESATTQLLVMPKNCVPHYKAKQLEHLYSVVYVDNVHECYDMVKNGEAKATFANAYVNQYMFGKREYRGLTAVASVESSTAHCVGIYKDSPKELISVMNKVILNMTEEEVNHYAMEATTEVENYSFSDWLYRNPAIGIGVTLGFVSITLLGMLIYVRERRRREKAMQYNLVTGTWNFSKFITEANRKLKNYSGEENYVILHMDICKFKYLNDNYGFEMGDNVLKTVGMCLKQGIRKDEIYGSLWADHFVCLVKCKDEAELYERGICLMESINERLSEIRNFGLTVKAGAYHITKRDIEKGNDVNHMIQYANHALATISDSYKNTMAFYNNDLKKEVENFRLVNQDMITAFYDRQFIPYYQPKFNIFTNEIIGAEALVRWKHPEKGLMPPCDFLPYFERSGFIVEVDLYIFEETCKNIKRWIDEGKQPIMVSCNFSRLHVENVTFVKQIKEIVNKYKVPYELLELELTETIAVEEMESTMKQISDLHDAGFHVSIDDFGSGYSSLSVLQQLKVDTIKLDKTFLKNGIPTDRERKVMEAIVNLAKQLQMKVICEGVETLAQVELLKQTHCIAAQGFYFAKPMPIEELDKLILMKK